MRSRAPPRGAGASAYDAACGGGARRAATLFRRPDNRPYRPDTPSLGTGPVDIRGAIHSGTNAARARHGLPDMHRDPGLDALAQAHAEDMAARGYRPHDAPEGIGPSGRAAPAGHDCRKDHGGCHATGIGENAAWWSGHSAGFVASSAVTNWMSSPARRGTSWGRIATGSASARRRAATAAPSTPCIISARNAAARAGTARACAPRQAAGALAGGSHGLAAGPTATGLDGRQRRRRLRPSPPDGRRPRRPRRRQSIKQGRQMPRSPRAVACAGTCSGRLRAHIPARTARHSHVARHRPQSRSCLAAGA